MSDLSRAQHADTLDTANPVSAVNSIGEVVSTAGTTDRRAVMHDANSNGVEDTMDIILGTSLDLDGDGVPDESESPLSEH
jgi:hypothetical protein